MKKSFKEAALAICAAQRIVLASHINPDGDALGSILALGRALRGMDKDVTILSEDGVPDIYDWMPDTETVLTSSTRRDFELAIVCDAGSLSRIGTSLLSIVGAAPTLINVDHHVPDTPFGDIRIIDTGASATAELVWQLIRTLEAATGRVLVDEDIARCLMTGIITDTGSFRYLNVTPLTFLLAARLQRLGAMPAPIAEEVFENRTLASIKLLGRALDSLRVTEDGEIAWAHVTARDFEELGATDAETEGIVNHVRAVKGARIGILFREVPGKKVRISMRARAGADVNRIAGVFGGGGHKLAAGCSVEPPLAAVESAVITESARQLCAERAPH